MKRKTALLIGNILMALGRSNCHDRKHCAEFIFSCI